MQLLVVRKCLSDKTHKISPLALELLYRMLVKAFKGIAIGDVILLPFLRPHTQPHYEKEIPDTVPMS